MRALLFTLFCLYVIVIAGDNYSTFLAMSLLSADVYEVNPLGRWGMNAFGLGTYLTANSLVSFFGVRWITYNSGLALDLRIMGLALLVVTRGYAVVNNFSIIHQLGG